MFHRHAGSAGVLVRATGTSVKTLTKNILSAGSACRKSVPASVMENMKNAGSGKTINAFGKSLGKRWNPSSDNFKVSD